MMFKLCTIDCTCSIRMRSLSKRSRSILSLSSFCLSISSRSLSLCKRSRSSRSRMIRIRSLSLRSLSAISLRLEVLFTSYATKQSSTSGCIPRQILSLNISGKDAGKYLLFFLAINFLPGLSLLGSSTLTFATPVGANSSRAIAM